MIICHFWNCFRITAQNLQMFVRNWSKTCLKVRGTVTVFPFLYPSPHPLYWWASQFIILLSEALYPSWRPVSVPVNKPLLYTLAMLQVSCCHLHVDEGVAHWTDDTTISLSSLIPWPSTWNFFIWCSAFSLEQLPQPWLGHSPTSNFWSSYQCTWERVQDVTYRDHLVGSGLTDCLLVQHLQ